jgi:putative hydrolase of the HAD superfamily
MSCSGAVSIRAVTFDVGGTMIEPWPSVGHIYAEVAEGCLAGSFDPAVLNERFAVAWKRAHAVPRRFDYSRVRWAWLVGETFRGLTARPDDKALFEALWRRFAEPAAWRIFPDVVPCLTDLRLRGLRLAVLSNWDERLQPLLARLGLGEHFETVIASAEVGVHKPDRAIFELAERSLGLSAGELLHVGDSAREDVAGARAAGWSARFLQRREPQEADALGTLAELTQSFPCG